MSHHLLLFLHSSLITHHFITHHLLLFLPLPAGNDEQRDGAEAERHHDDAVLLLDDAGPVFEEIGPVAAKEGGDGRCFAKGERGCGRDGERTRDESEPA